MSILKARATYRPFFYPTAYDFFLKQQKSHWLWTEVNMTQDVKDFRENLTKDEQTLILRILRLFTQSEILVNEYWSSVVCKYFPHPEIQQMASTFASFEAIHTSAYDILSQNLNVDTSEYSAFIVEPSMANKIQTLSNALNINTNPDGTPIVSDLMRSLAVFSGFTEGVSLFASFASLLTFSRKGVMKGVADIVSWSSADEAQHSDAGCWLFQEMSKEFPQEDVKQSVIDAGKIAIALEFDYLDYVYKGLNIEHISVETLKHYVKHRANQKFQQLGLPKQFRPDKELAQSISSWYDPIVSGKNSHDFFSRKSNAYAKGVFNPNIINFEEPKYE